MFKNKKGFTIVELVIVIAVIAILAAVLIPTFSSVIENANKSAAVQEAKASIDIVAMEENLDTSVTMSNYKYIVVSEKYAFVYTTATGLDTASPVKFTDFATDKTQAQYVALYKDDVNKFFAHDDASVTAAMKPEAATPADAVPVKENADISAKVIIVRVDADTDFITAQP